MFCCQEYFPWEISGRCRCEQTALIKPRCTCPFCQWPCLNFRKMRWIVCVLGDSSGLSGTKRRHMACLIPGLQRACDYVILNTVRRLELQKWKESHCCFVEIPLLRGKTRKRTAEGTILFCEKPACKVKIGYYLGYSCSSLLFWCFQPS